MDINLGQVGTLLLPAVYGAGANNGTTFDLQAAGMNGPLTVILDTGAVAGTNPTLDVKLQQGALANASDMADMSISFTQVIAANQLQVKVAVFPTKQYLRVVATVGGTSTPTVAANAVVICPDARKLPS